MSGPKCDAIELRRQEKQRRKEEYQKRLKAEQARKRAEAQERIRLAEERRHLEEEKRLAEERRRQEEARRAAEEKRRIEEERRLAEERRRQEEAHRAAEERRRLEEEQRLAEEFNAGAEASYQALRRFQERRKAELGETADRCPYGPEAGETVNQHGPEQHRPIGYQPSEDVPGVPSELRQRYEEALSLYEAAAALAGEQAEHFSFAPETAEAQIDEMNRLVEMLQERTVEKECRAQVSRLIDRVITDMGYEILGEKVSGSAEGAGARLYRYEGDTAISVIDGNGQFTMEVVAPDEQDRPATPEEAERLYESMGKFCGDYEKIREKLEETGQVVSRNLFRLPPDRRLARVINREEYEKRDRKKKRKHDESYTEGRQDEKRRIQEGGGLSHL